MTAVSADQPDLPSAPPPLESEAPPLNVLVVDDDDATRVALTYILQQNSFQADQAGSGQEALGRMNEKRYDVVLLDLQMPIMDGIHTLAQMRRSSNMNNIPVVVISHQTDREQVMQCVALGVRHFVAKQSLNIADLIERLRDATVPCESQAEEPAADGSGVVLPTIDRDQWRAQMEKLGRVTREETQQKLSQMAVPVIFSPGIEEIKSSILSGESAQNLVQDIEQEPHLLTGVLDLANCSQDSSSDAVDIETAIQWIGNAGLEEVVNKLGGAESAISEETKPWIHRWWSHSVAMAQLAERLASAVRISKAEARAAGMIHDLGRLMLLSSDLAPKVVACYEATPDLAISTGLAEQVLFGMNHKQVGQEICKRHNIPNQLAAICDTHDFDDSARSRLDQYGARLSALINAADVLAKASGYGSLPNDELMPLPEVLAKTVDDLRPKLDAALAEIQTLISWRTGGNDPNPSPATTPLKGIVVVILASHDGPANPFVQTLTRAGANVTVFGETNDLIDAKPLFDVLVLDQTNESVVQAVPMLRRLSKGQNFAEIPQLLLIRSGDDPETVIRQSGLDLAIYPTPIRINSLIQAVRSLAGS